MIDRQARDSAANALRDFMKASISNREYERRYPRSKGDPAVWSIYSNIWFFYSDSSEHVLSGKYSLTQDGLAFMERCLLFLQSDLDFQWPNTKVHIWYPVLRLIGLGGIVNRRIAKQMSFGDKEVWPFLRKADYDMMRVKGES